MKKFWLSWVAISFLACNNQKEEGFISPEKFSSPPVEYLSVPFYSLNDKLDTTELSRQLEVLKEGGFGGTFLHSRIGLLTEYLGKEWWDAMDAGVKTSEKLGITAWFYDEDKWPSGFAGGKIPRASEDFHARSLLRLGKNDSIPPQAQILFENDSNKFVVNKVMMGNAWFNGTCWVDLMNPAMVKAFIDTTYVPYVEKYRSTLGKTSLGMFTDEPQINPQAAIPGMKAGVPNRGIISYSPVVPPKFKEMHGYDLIPHIASLFDSVGNYRKVRIDYFRTLSRCFEENFSKQIGDYCKKNNFIFTGHYMGEETPSSVTNYLGNAMIHYRHMQVPGIDHLGLRIEGGLNVAKSCASVANQYGIERRLSEAYGTAGQNMSFEDRKWILDWHTLCGINFICPHLTLYSMKGERKRDYPQTISPQQPFWKYNSFFENYSARLCYVTSLGKYAADILVIHPLESAYIEYSTTKFNWNCPRDLTFLSILKALQNAHRDYDLGDEQIISEIGKIKDGQFVIGKMSYKAVVLPNMLTIRPSTLNLLKEFKKQGGKIIAVETYPSYVDGEENKIELDHLQKNAGLTTLDRLGRTLKDILTPAYELTGENSEKIWAHQRLVKNGKIFQFSNTSRLSTIHVTLSLNHGDSTVALWDPANGKAYTLKKNPSNKYNITFAPTQTWVISTGKASGSAVIASEYNPVKSEKKMMEISGKWVGKRIDANAITLDFAKYSMDQGRTFSTPEPIIGIHQRFRNNQYNGPLQLLFEINIESLPSTLDLVVEQPEMYNIQVNGNEVKFSGNDFYRDFSFKKQSVLPFMKKGGNTILLTLDYKAPIPASYNAYERYGSEIESIYLTGDFGVNAKVSKEKADPTQRNADGTFPFTPVNYLSSFTLGKEKQEFEGDLVSQGYPFYAGDFMLNKKIKFTKEEGKKYFLSFPAISTTVLKVEVNDQEVAMLAFSPWEADITNAMKNGENQIRLTLTNTLRNLLGPHHHAEGELTRVGPDSFSGSRSWTGSWKGEWNWYDVRLNGKPGIWRDTYCMVPLGLLGNPQISEVEY